MEKKKLSKEKVEEILRELESRKGANNPNYRFATMKDTEDIIGNVAACTDCDSIDGTEGGAGNMSGCADDVCDEEIVGNVAACTDCDDIDGTEGGAGNMSGCADNVC